MNLTGTVVLCGPNRQVSKVAYLTPGRRHERLLRAVERPACPDDNQGQIGDGARLNSLEDDGSYDIRRSLFVGDIGECPVYKGG